MCHQGFNHSFTKLQEKSAQKKKKTLFNNSSPAWCSWHRTAYVVYVQWIFSKMVLGWRGGDKLLNKVVFFPFAHKKYSRSFVKLWLNLWCHMDYFTDLLATFLDLGTFQLYCCLWEGQTALRCHQKYLNLCSEDKRRSYRFETTWGWVITDRIFIFGWTNPLTTTLLRINKQKIRSLLRQKS